MLEQCLKHLIHAACQSRLNRLNCHKAVLYANSASSTANNSRGAARRDATCRPDNRRCRVASKYQLWRAMKNLHASKVLACFDRLHRTQAVVRFSSSFVPPQAIESIWSHSSGTSEIKQYWQVNSSLSNILRLVCSQEYPLILPILLVL